MYPVMYPNLLIPLPVKNFFEIKRSDPFKKSEGLTIFGFC